MAHVPASNSSAGGDRYRRHRPEDTLLYQVVDQYNPESVSAGTTLRPLPPNIPCRTDSIVRHPASVRLDLGSTPTNRGFSSTTRFSMFVRHSGMKCP